MLKTSSLYVLRNVIKLIWHCPLLTSFLNNTDFQCNIKYTWERAKLKFGKYAIDRQLWYLGGIWYVRYGRLIVNSLTKVALPFILETEQYKVCNRSRIVCLFSILSYYKRRV